MPSLGSHFLVIPGLNCKIISVIKHLKGFTIYAKEQVVSLMLKQPFNIYLTAFASNIKHSHCISEINFDPFVEYHCGTFHSSMANAWRSRDCEATLPYVCKKYLNRTGHEAVGKCLHFKSFSWVAYLSFQYIQSPLFLLITHNLHWAKASFVLIGIKTCNKIIPEI